MVSNMGATAIIPYFVRDTFPREWAFIRIVVLASGVLPYLEPEPSGGEHLSVLDGRSLVTFWFPRPRGGEFSNYNCPIVYYTFITS